MKVPAVTHGLALSLSLSVSCLCCVCLFRGLVLLYTKYLLFFYVALSVVIFVISGPRQERQRRRSEPGPVPGHGDLPVRLLLRPGRVHAKLVLRLCGLRLHSGNRRRTRVHPLRHIHQPIPGVCEMN